MTICPHCHQHACTTTRLHDGQEVCTWSEQWRAECEARHIMNLPTLEERRAYLFGTFERTQSYGKWINKCVAQGIQQRRGDQVLAQVQELVTELWRKNNNQPKQRQGGIGS